MTWWAKLLTIVVCIFSLAFAGMSAVIFAKRSNYRAEVKREREARNDEVKKANGEIARLVGLVNDRNLENATLRGTIKTKEEEIARGVADREVLQTQFTDSQNRLNTEQASVKQLTVSVDALRTDNSRLAADNEKARTDLNDYMAKLSTEQKRSNELAKENSSLKETLDGTQKRLATANETINLHEQTFQELSKRNIEARKVISGLIALPDIKGKVIGVDATTNIVVINVGSKQQVRKNYDFTLFRGDKFVAVVNVFDVQEELCAARVVTRNTTIQQGDNAWTRLQ